MAEKQGFFEPREKIEELFKYTFSLSTVLHFCVIMGYNRIVLCGVDLKTLDYFYNDPEKYTEFAGFRKKSHIEENHTVSSYLFKSDFAVPFDQVIFAFQRQILNKRNIRLEIESKSSALYPALPLYESAS